MKIFKNSIFMRLSIGCAQLKGEAWMKIETEKTVKRESENDLLTIVKNDVAAVP